MYSDDSDDISEEVDVYRKKYRLITERCEVIQQDNERLVNRIHHIKKMLKRRRKERKFLMDRLDMHGDNWRNIPLSLKLEDNSEHSVSSKAAIIKISKGNTTPSDKQKKIIKKKGHKVDKNAPKRPANPYFQFCQEQRTSTIEEMTTAGQPEPSKIDVTKHLAYKWNLLSQDDKKAEILVKVKIRDSHEKLQYYVLSIDFLNSLSQQITKESHDLKIYYDMYKKSKERYKADMQLYTTSKSN